MFDGEETRNPFPGLRAFEPDEDHLFFGREEQIDELLGRLRRTRFLSVVGTSGSGKSSLIRSGLIPSLYSGFMTQAGSSWRVAVMRPGSDPIGNLAAALNDPEVIGGDEELADMNRALLETTLLRSAVGLVDCVRQARLPEGENLLVLADQFEELFRFKQNLRIKDSRDAALGFVKLLLEATRQDEVPIYVVLTMRSDFIGNCTEFPGLAEAVNDGQYLVPRMTREERKAAIVGPVAVGGAEISPRLVLRLLNDVGDDPDQLPILQHALMRTWDYWQAHHTDGEPVDLRHYEATGTMSEALSLHAEEAYRELESADERRAAELMFKALTDAGSDARGVRRPTPLGEICELTGADQDTVVAVIERFRAPGRTFLMPPAGTPLTADSVIDISHESLMRTWRRLIEWVDEEARSAQVYLQLSKAAALYQEGKAGLFRDPELQIAVNWRDKNLPTETWAHRYDPAFERAMLFLEYSEKERELEIAEKERQRRKQLVRARRLMAAAAVVGLVFLLLGVFALWQMVEAENQAAVAREAEGKANAARDEALRQKQATERQKLVAEDAKRLAEDAKRLAEEEKERAEDERERAQAKEREAKLQQDRALRAERVARDAADEAKRQETAALEQKQLAEAASTQAQRSAAEALRLRRVALSRAVALQALRLPEDSAELGSLLALAAHRLNRKNGGNPEAPDVFNALRTSLNRLAPDRVRTFRHARDAVRSLALGSDGRTLAVGSDDGGVSLIDLGAPEARPAEVAQLGTEVRSVALGAGVLAAGGYDGVIRIFDLERRGAPPRLLEGHGAVVGALAFAPGGTLLASAGADRKVGLWVLDGTQVTFLDAPDQATAVDFSPAGDRLAVATRGGVALWRFDAAGNAAAPEILDAGQHVRSVAWSPDGRLLAAGTQRGPVELWDVTRSTARSADLPGHESPVTDLAFSARGRLASASLDGSVKLWDVARPEAEPLVFTDHDGWVWTVALDVGGETLISGGADAVVRVWPTRTQVLADEVCRRVSRSLSLEEWQDYLPADVEYEELCPGGSA